MALVSGQISVHKNYDQDFTSSKEHGCKFQSTWVQNCFLIDFSRIPSSSANFFFFFGNFEPFSQFRAVLVCYTFLLSASVKERIQGRSIWNIVMPLLATRPPRSAMSTSH